MRIGNTIKAMALLFALGSAVTASGCFPGLDPLEDDASDGTEGAATDGVTNDSRVQFDTGVDPDTGPATDTSPEPDTSGVTDTTVDPDTSVAPDTASPGDTVQPTDTADAADAVQCSGPSDCAHLDGACVRGECDGQACVAVPAEDAPCDDGDPCTVNDTCDAEGRCVGAPMMCEADACTGPLACVDGACVGDDPVVCEPLSQCHQAGTCDPNTGACSTPLAAVDAPCDLGAAADALGYCRGGTCHRRQVAVGFPEVCLLFDNKVRCWGEGEVASAGETWDFGTRTVAEIAVIFEINSRPLRCVRFEDGGVRCWGDPDSGLMGQGGREVPEPGDPHALEDIFLGGAAVQLSIGVLHACAVLDGGGLRCWGRSSSGALGLGSRHSLGDEVAPGDVPVDLGGEAAVAVSAGFSHTCVILQGGRVRCWGGALDVGALGYGSEISSYGGAEGEVPAGLPDVSLGFSAAEIHTGDFLTCARAPSGVVRCWGRNGSGQLGLGHADDVGDQVPSALGTVALGAAAVQLSTGAFGNNTCALLDTGSVRCWGQDYSGALGLGFIEHIGDDERPADVDPVALDGAAAGVSAGATATCAWLVDGGINCWGSGARLGYADGESRGHAPGTMPPGLVPFE